MKLPRITVVTPSYNQAQFLGQTLDSVLGQGYPDLEYFVLDGGSTDGSKALIEAQAARLALWKSERDGGQAAAIREGFERATGEVICWLNSDDCFEPGALQAVGEAFAAHPEADIVYGSLRFVEQHGKELFVAHLVLDEQILAHDAPYVGQPAMFWRRSAVQRVGGVDPTYRFSMDYDLVMRLVRAGAKSVKLRQVLASFRIHPASKSSNLRAVSDAEVRRVLEREGLWAQRSFARTWRNRLKRFALDPRCVPMAVLSRLRTRIGPDGFIVR